MSNVDTPPDPWFSNIIFNPEYFVAPIGGSGGISQSYADSHYLQSGANVNAISTANSTIFNNKVNIYGNVGIGMSGNPKGILDVRGRTFINILEASTVPYTNGNQLMVCGFGNANFNSPMQLTINDTNAINMALYIGTNYNGAIADSYSSIQSAYFGTGVKPLALNAGGGNIGIGTTNPKALLDLSSTTQYSSRLILTGQEYIQAGQTSTDGVAFILGVNRTNDRQLWLCDSARLAFNATNPKITISTSGDISCVSTDHTVKLPLSFNGALTAISNFNVGIGSTNPQTKLDVNGTYFSSLTTTGLTGIGTTGSNGGYRLILYQGNINEYPYGLGIAGNTLWNGVPANGRFEWYSGSNLTAKLASNGQFTIEKNLIVGNDNLNPQIQLGTSTNNIGVASTAGAFSSSSASGDMVIRTPNKLLLQSGTGVAPFCINTNNFILLGKGLTVIPTFPVTVNTNEETNQFMASPYSAAISSGFNTNYLTTNPGIGFGVLCSAAFSTACFFYSDRRIKKDFEPINNSLEILEKINLTKYKYIDFVVKGNMTHYGVIAQEVEEVIPEIMNTHKDFIPNIYKNANSYDGLNTIYIDTTDITIGDKIKIYNDTNQEYLIDVVDVDVDANYIVIKNPIENYKQDTLLFFYGKEIPDFKHVNYDALFVINMKATQELYKRLKAIETWAISMGMGAPI